MGQPPFPANGKTPSNFPCSALVSLSSLRCSIHGKQPSSLPVWSDQPLGSDGARQLGNNRRLSRSYCLCRCQSNEARQATSQGETKATKSMTHALFRNGTLSLLCFAVDWTSLSSRLKWVHFRLTRRVLAMNFFYVLNERLWPILFNTY